MSENQLKRAIGQLGIAALAINGLIGAGIFALPAGAAELSGNFSPWAFLICALLIALVVVSFAQLSKGFSNTGGPVAYTQQAFGAHAAFQTTWLLYVGRLTALAANTNALVLYLSFFIPAISAGLLHGFAVFTVLMLLLAINLRTVNKSIRIINVLTVIKLLPLIVFIIVGFSYWDNSKFFSFESANLDNLDATLLLLVYAYIGFEGAVVPAGESKKPTQLIAKALIATLLFTAILYFLLQSITLSILPNVAASERPIADAAGVMFGEIGILIISIAAIVSISGNLSTVVFTAPRMTFALGEQGSLPRWFALVDKQNHIPKNSIVFLIIIALILALTGSFVWLAIVSSLARLIGYFVTIASLIKLKSNFHEQDWFLPLGNFIPLLALGVCVWLAATANWQTWLTTAGFMLLGSGLFFISQKRFIARNENVYKD